jgi:hypothetical protein
VFEDAPTDRVGANVHMDECACVVSVFDVLCNLKKKV